MTQFNPPPQGPENEFDYATPPGYHPGYGPDKESRDMAMLCHLLGIFTGFVGPLILWLIKKDRSPYVNQQGAQSLNFQFTVMLMYLACIPLCALLIGFLLIPVVAIAHLVFGIIGTVAASKGEPYRYPIAIPFIRS